MNHLVIINRKYSLLNIPKAPPDKVLGLVSQFNDDTNKRKVNLTVGIYKDQYGKMNNFPCVTQAQCLLRKDTPLSSSSSYLPILGDSNFRKNVMDFLFKESAPIGSHLVDKNRISLTQTLSGTGALAIAADLIVRFISNTIWIPKPSWPNHLNIFQRHGFSNVKEYTYYRNGYIDIDSWMSDLEESLLFTNIKSTHCILLHACCHNPTGLDPTEEQWKIIIKKIHDLNMIPIIDMAYQGLESGDLIKDAYLLRFCLEYNWPNGIFLCQSFAKNMGLYGERVGSLSIVLPTEHPTLKFNVDSQLKKIIRGLYSSPPSYGSKIANIILSDPGLKEQWFKDVKEMTNRLWDVRLKMYERLHWECLIDRNKQHGMFYYTGLSENQVNVLRDIYSIYLTPDGRMSLSGIKDSDLDYVSESLLRVTTKS